MADHLDEIRKVMQNGEQVALPEGMEIPQEDETVPEDYMPPPPPLEDDGRGSSDEPVNPIELAAREPLNDIGNGNRFRIHFGQDICYVAQVGWHIWDSRRWLKDAEISKGVSPRIRQLAQKMSALIEQEIDFIQPSKRDRQLLNEERDLRKRRIEIEGTAGYADDETMTTELGNIAARLRAIDGALKSHKSLIGRRLTHAKNAGNSGPMTNMAAEAQVELARSVDEMDRGDLDINTLSGVLRFSKAPDPASGMSSMPKVELVAHDLGLDHVADRELDSPRQGNGQNCRCRRQVGAHQHDGNRQEGSDDRADAGNEVQQEGEEAEDYRQVHTEQR